jgi:hypothetical protein
MSILNFVNQDQLDELDEDPQTAFMELVNHAQRSLHEQTKGLNDSEDDWRKIEELRHSFMNVVLASAKRFEIEPFVSLEVPTRRTFDMRDFDQFNFDLDHYITQLVLDNSLRAKRDTVEILPKSKDAIRAYIHKLRECIESANMTDQKREALLKRLDALQVELEKRRVNMVTIAKVAFALWAVPGSAWGSWEAADKLITKLMRNVAEAKEIEDQKKQLPNTQPPKALSPPRKETPAPRQAAFGDGLDDEIPF